MGPSTQFFSKDRPFANCKKYTHSINCCCECISAVFFLQCNVCKRLQTFADRFATLYYFVII